jgi:hypothetical protein
VLSDFGGKYRSGVFRRAIVRPERLAVGLLLTFGFTFFWGGAITTEILGKAGDQGSIYLVWFLVAVMTCVSIVACTYWICRLEITPDQLSYRGPTLRTTIISKTSITKISLKHRADYSGHWIVLAPLIRLVIPESITAATDILTSLQSEIHPKRGVLDGTYYCGLPTESRWIPFALGLALAVLVPYWLVTTPIPNLPAFLVGMAFMECFVLFQFLRLNNERIEIEDGSIRWYGFLNSLEAEMSGEDACNFIAKLVSRGGGVNVFNESVEELKKRLDR